MKLIKLIGKAAFVFLTLTYAVCLVNGMTVVEYCATDDGGALTVAGRTIEINNALADALRKTYTEAEARAAEWLPPKIKSAVNRISDLVNGN